MDIGTSPSHRDDVYRDSEEKKRYHGTDLKQGIDPGVVTVRMSRMFHVNIIRPVFKPYGK